jgi:hypothetical protein
VELIVAISTAKSPEAIVNKVTLKLPNFIDCLGMWSVIHQMFS